MRPEIIFCLCGVMLFGCTGQRPENLTSSSKEYATADIVVGKDFALGKTTIWEDTQLIIKIESIDVQHKSAVLVISTSNGKTLRINAHEQRPLNIPASIFNETLYMSNVSKNTVGIFYQTVATSRR